MTDPMERKIQENLDFLAIMCDILKIEDEDERKRRATIEIERRAESRGKAKQT